MILPPPHPREHEIAERFDRWLGEMIASAPSILSPELLEAVESYGFEGKMKRDFPREKWERYLRGVMRGEEWLVRRLLEGGVDLFVELGCGLGTWCFLAALAGARHVMGIDLCEGRLEAARVFARERFAAHCAAKVEFVFDNLFNVAYERPVNVFYLKCSVHHVLPIPALFDYLYENLAPGGLVVVHDANALHPLTQIAGFRMRGFRRRVPSRDPRTGEPTEYAMEDYFTLPGIVRRFRKRGFRIAYLQAYLGGRSASGDVLWEKAIEPLNRSMLLGAFLAQTYQIVAQKPD